MSLKNKQKNSINKPLQGGSKKALVFAITFGVFLLVGTLASTRSAEAATGITVRLVFKEK